MNNKTLSGMKCILYLFILLALPAQAASFDCAKVVTMVEKVICGDAELSKLDEEMNTAYKVALRDEKQADAIKHAQKQWVKERNSCDKANCLKTAYQARIHELSPMPIQSEVLPQSALYDEESAGSIATVRKYPPYPDAWQWEFQGTLEATPLELSLLSNGDILAGKSLLFGGQTVVHGELLEANTRGDLVKLNKRNVLLLSDGTQLSGIKGMGLSNRIRLSTGLEVASVGSNLSHGQCDHGPINYVFHTHDEKTGASGPNKVIFILLDKPKQRMWDQPRSTPKANEEVSLCAEEGPPGYTTKVEAAWGKMFPLDDGTFLLSMSNGLIVRFDDHFNTKSALLNRRIFIFDTNNSNLFIDKINGKKYDLEKTGYQPVYDDLYQYLSHIRSNQP